VARSAREGCHWSTNSKDLKGHQGPQGRSYVLWEPTCRAKVKPAARKTFSRVVQGRGVSRGTDLNAQSQVVPFESYKVGRDPVVAATLVAAILEDLFEGSGIRGCEKERANRLIQRQACRVRSRAAAHDVQRHRMGHVLAFLFPDVHRRLQMHVASLAGCSPAEALSPSRRRRYFKSIDKAAGGVEESGGRTMAS